MLRSGRTAEAFWPALHIDLRMVDTSDFVIAYVPTNVYSVGTVHEIVLARTQRKPVLFVSPPVSFPTVDKLEKHLTKQGDTTGLELLKQVRDEVPIKPNEKGAPSLWYLPLIGGEHFFDGFGFAEYQSLFENWEAAPLDQQEARHRPKSRGVSYPPRGRQRAQGRVAVNRWHLTAAVHGGQPRAFSAVHSVSERSPHP